MRFSERQRTNQERWTETPPKGVDSEEFEAHLRGMPERYWEHITKAELIWALETVHAFLAKLKGWEASGAPVVATLRHYPERGFTKVMVCSWDRPGLLAKIAASFSALRINILQADVYTRADNIVLDIFQVLELNDAKQLEHLIFILEGALNDPPRFVSVWARQFHRLSPLPAGDIVLELDAESSPEHTILHVEAPDRLGLLYDILEALHQCSVNVAQAVVNTEAALARDIFYLTDLDGKKITQKLALGAIRKVVIEALQA